MTLAERLEGRSGWRLELAMAAADGEADAVGAALPKGARTWSQEEIGRRLDEAEALLRRAHDEAAYLLAWAVGEAAMRAVLGAAGVRVKHPTPLVLVKTLYAYGLLGRPDYEVLHRHTRIRDTLARGAKPGRFDSGTVERFIESVRRLRKIDLRVQA